jgi:Na+-transporting NADH:ubiquinone oxidoreductase subunit F
VIPEEIFNIQKYNATVVSNDNVATFIKELVLKLDEGQAVDFTAGAYMQIDVPEYQAEFSDFAGGRMPTGKPGNASTCSLSLKAGSDKFRSTGLTRWPARRPKGTFCGLRSGLPHRLPGRWTCRPAWDPRSFST